jgi:putative two-component system response regulator
VADVFDALTSERPYRRALSPEAATRAITVESGVRYDPDVVTGFVARRQAIAAIVDHVESKAS